MFPLRVHDMIPLPHYCSVQRCKTWRDEPIITLSIIILYTLQDVYHQRVYER